MIKIKRIFLIVLSSILLITISGCSSGGKEPGDQEKIPSSSPSTIPSPSPTEEPERNPAQITSIEVLPDKSYRDFFLEDPYSELSSQMMEANAPERELYNYLFQAVMSRVPSVSITQFDVTDRQIMDTVSCLYEQAGYQLFYLYRAKWSKDYTSVTFTYTEDTQEEINEYQDIFYAQMNHMLYNVAPSTYTPTQRFFALYDYIIKHADYTDDMSDQTTFAANSIVVKKKGICGGFSILAKDVLNFVGVPAEYISNEPHAWNIVTLNGNRYHTDFTWGAGSAFSEVNFLTSALMDDDARLEGLDQMGFGGYQIIHGYPRDNPSIPVPCTDDRYAFLKDIYPEYALDIDNEWIYYEDGEGVHRIHLDATGKETITSQYAYPLTLYNEVLYYVVYAEGLYEYNPGQAPVLLKEFIDDAGIMIDQGILTYGKGAEAFTLDLNTIAVEDFSQEESKQLEDVTISKQQTFQIDITFDQSMNTEKLPVTSFSLVNGAGEQLPLHMTWSETGEVLTIRSKAYINEEAEVTLYVYDGIEDGSELFTEDRYELTIQFVAEE